MPLVQTKDGPARLFQFVGKSLNKILPQGCPRYRISNLTARLRPADYFVGSIESSKQVVMFIDFGPIDFNVLGDSRETEYEVKVLNKSPEPSTYSISRYPLAPYLVCVKILTAFEKALNVF